MTTSSKEKIPDLYGQIHPNETPDFIRNKLNEFEDEINKLPKEKRIGIDQAQEKCPELIDDGFKLKFLRCEVFNVYLAVKRYSFYWDKRIEVFGPEKAFLPLTQVGALKDDEVALSRGLIKVLPTKAPSGRSVMFYDPSLQDFKLYSRESMIRATWYLFHSSLMNCETTQKKGIIFIVFPRNAKFSQFDKKYMSMMSECVKGCIPMRLTGIHLCNPPTFFSILFSFIKILLGERLRKRLHVHSGSKKKVLSSLSSFGLTEDKLPSQIGGSVSLDHNIWLQEQAVKER